MRSGQQKQRSRGRSSNGGSGSNTSHSHNVNNNSNRKGQNPLTRTYDSSGPDVKIRGTAQNIAEKYMTLARDATSAGDRVMAENYLQHAEHYNRIIAAAQAMYQERFQRDDRQEFGDRDDDDGDNGQQDGMQMDVGAQPREMPAQREQSRDAQQPRENQQPREQSQREQQPRREREHREPRQPREPREQPIAAEQPRMVIDESTPQPVIDGMPAEVQIEAEVTSQENAAAAAPARRRAAGRPRRTPRATAEGTDAKPSDEPAAPVEVPAE